MFFHVSPIHHVYFILFCGSVSLAELREALGMFFHVSPKSSRYLAPGKAAQQRLLDMWNVQTLLLSVYSRCSLNTL